MCWEAHLLNHFEIFLLLFKSIVTFLRYRKKSNSLSVLVVLYPPEPPLTCDSSHPLVPRILLQIFPQN